MYESHPNAIPHLDGIRDNSMGDVFCPWKVKNEPKEEFDDNGFSDNDSHDETFYIPETDDTKDYQKLHRFHLFQPFSGQIMLEDKISFPK